MVNASAETRERKGAKVGGKSGCLGCGWCDNAIVDAELVNKKAEVLENVRKATVEWCLEEESCVKGVGHGCGRRVRLGEAVGAEEGCEK